MVNDSAAPSGLFVNVIVTLSISVSSTSMTESSVSAIATGLPNSTNPV